MDRVLTIELSIEPDTFGDGFVAELRVETPDQDPSIGQFSTPSAVAAWHAARSAIAEIMSEDRDAPSYIIELDEIDSPDDELDDWLEQDDEHTRRGLYD